MALGYLLGAAFQAEDSNGKPLTGGTVRVCLHNTTEPYITYKDFEGDRNPEYIPLDESGMAVILASDSHVYDVYCYNRFGVDEWSRLNVTVGGSGGGGSGETYYAGNGIDINDVNEISVDQNVVALKNEIPATLSAGTGIQIANNQISRKVQFVSTSNSYSYVRSIIDAGDLPVLDRANGSMHDYFVCTMYRGSDIQFVGSAYGQTTLYTLASNNTWTSQILEPQILQGHANKFLAINSAGTDAEWQAVRQVPTYAVADTYKFLGVVNNGGTVQLAWTVPGGYWTSSTSLAQSHDVTAEDIAAGYFDLFMQVTATDTSTTLYDTPAFFALSWDVQWHTQGNPGNLDSLTFAAGVDGGSYVDLFSDTSPAHAVHKDWGITKAWSAGNRYNRIRVRFALNSTTQVGDGFMLYAGGIVNQVRG